MDWFAVEGEGKLIVAWCEGGKVAAIQNGRCKHHIGSQKVAVQKQLNW
jgi:hypothetical protein